MSNRRRIPPPPGLVLANGSPVVRHTDPSLVVNVQHSGAVALGGCSGCASPDLAARILHDVADRLAAGQRGAVPPGDAWLWLDSPAGQHALEVLVDGGACAFARDPETGRTYVAPLGTPLPDGYLAGRLVLGDES